MSQSAAEIPALTLQRKAAIARGGVLDHVGRVKVTPIENFDLERTIFKTLEGWLPRFVMRTRIAKAVDWSESAREQVEAEYLQTCDGRALPAVDPALLRFLEEDCDFDVEHADGSFLDHLYFCFEYSHLHFPQHSSLVMLLHSILGTGTNTFAMTKEKIPALKPLMDDFEWRHVEAFPSILRLLYAQDIRHELWSHKDRLDTLQSVSFHRVIDNEPLEMSADDFWIQLNYQLMHLIDFLPAANWSAHANDTSFIIFRDLYAFLKDTGKMMANISYQPPVGSTPVQGEPQGVGAKLITYLPVALSEKMAAKSIRRFSERIGHSLDYRLNWASTAS